MIDDIELVEFHDAQVARIELTTRGSACIEFSHLPVYRRETPSTFGVWSFHAELRFDAINDFKVQGPPPRHEADSVEAFVLVGTDLARIEPVDLLRHGAIQYASAELRWALSGALVMLYGGEVSLVLLNPIERVETWPA